MAVIGKKLFLGCVCLTTLVYVLNSWIRHHDGNDLLEFKIMSKTSPIRFSKGRAVPNASQPFWIVVTTINQPTPDIKFLSRIPGWKVVVVGDTKTPDDWSYPNCVYLNIEDQRALGFETVQYIPVKSYARKIVGYLYAISQGARVIYETDDDNRPNDLLRNFVLNDSMWGLLYNGENLFNPYRHFGQPTLWPRGYPLMAVGENISTDYLLNEWKTPSIQQGVVNGDPDMDAIFRLTRKRHNIRLNVSFDQRAPPVIVPRGVFSPFNSQNTLFLYDALWALLIPTTTTFRVCDIWRGYWSQRLLWEIGGNLGFFPPNAFQTRNSHSYLLDAIDEEDLYFQTDRLITFLTDWRCEKMLSFFECVIKLSGDMARNRFWEEGDVTLAIAWIHDLIALGYEEPKRSVYEAQIGSFRAKVKPSQSAIKETAVNFWAEEQLFPLPYPVKLLKPNYISYVSRITTYCKNVHQKTPKFDVSAKVETYPHILLVVVFKSPIYNSVHLLEMMYSLHFSHIAYCGEKRDLFMKSVKNIQKPLTFLEAEGDSEETVQLCLIQAMRMGYSVDSYLVITNHVLLNTWNVKNLPAKLSYPKTDILFQNRSTDSVRFKNPKHFLRKRNAIAGFKFIDNKRFRKFFEMLKMNTKSENGLFYGTADIIFIPKRYKEDVLYFLQHFSKNGVIHEIAIPTVFAGIEKVENIHRPTYVSIGDDWTRLFNKSSTYLQPLKMSNGLNRSKFGQFLCETYFPLSFNMSTI